MSAQIVGLKLIAAYRIDDHVLLFTDTPMGWTYFTAWSRVPRDKWEEYITEATKQLGPDGSVRSDGTVGSIVWTPMANTTLPPDFPDRAVVGMHPSLYDESTPIFTPRGDTP